MKPAQETEEVTQVDILIIEDDKNTAVALSRVVGSSGYSVKWSDCLSDVLGTLLRFKPRIVLLDLSLPDGDGIEFIKQIKLAGVTEVIVISGTNDAVRTRDCLKAGVFDFIQKPASAADILLAIRRADGVRRVQVPQSAQYPAILRPGFGSLEGRSEAARKMIACLSNTAKLESFNALIEGPSGVLKADVVALLHHYSRRSGEALLVNCSSETDDLVEQRFFGYQPSEQTLLAQKSTPSYLKSAHMGALVLDDISALPLRIQRRLSVFIERGEVLSECALVSTACDCNVIGILRESIESALDGGRIYEPLFYQLAKNTLVVPSLADRSDDIRYYAEKAILQLNEAYATEKSLSLAYINQLSKYGWPGNLVELKNCLFNAYQSTEAGDEIKPSASWLSSPSELRTNQIKTLLGQSFYSVEKQLIEATLAANDNNKSKSAEILGISLKTLYNRLSIYSEATKLDKVG